MKIRIEELLAEKERLIKVYEKNDGGIITCTEITN